MALTLHLVRHPPPEIAPGICYGQLDVPARLIDETATRLKPLLSPGVPVWSSPLQRARRLAEALHPAPCLDARLAEMHFGIWEGQSWDAIGATAVDAWAADVAGFAPPGGESGRQVQHRALAWLNEIDVPELLVITHAGVMRVLLAHFLALPSPRWMELRFEFGAVTRLEIDQKTGRLLHRNS